MKAGGKKRSWNKSCTRSSCAITCVLDLLGDKWSLLVVCQLLWSDKRLYNELMECQEGISSSILANRLKRLEQAGIVVKSPYQQKPVRYAYELTPAGIALHPVLREMLYWGNAHWPDTLTVPEDVIRRAEQRYGAGKGRIDRRRGDRARAAEPEQHQNP